jgi:ASC-1-like (ASCH) protein
MLYQMKLHEESFGRVQSGQKTLELRVFDEKRQRLNLGDRVEFANAADLSQTVRTEIVGLLRYNALSDLIDDMPAAYLGFEENEKRYIKESMFEIYTPEEEKQYGVLGIRIRLAEKEAESA